MEEHGWNNLRQFTNWWWRNFQPYRVPEDAVKVSKGSHEFVMFREGRFQVEQVTLFPEVPVQKHHHPNINTYECHITGSGSAWLDGRELPFTYDYNRGSPMSRRLLIKAGEPHWGVAKTVVVALSFQEWLNGVPPTHITDDWVGEPWE